MTLLGFGCAAPQSKPNAPVSQKPSGQTQPKPKSEPEFRPINAIAYWAESNEFLIGTNEVSQNNEVFALRLEEPLDEADGLRFRSIYPHSVNSIVVSPDQKWAAMDEIGSTGPSLVVLLSAEMAGPVALLHGPEDYASLAFMPGGKRLAMASGGEIYSVDLEKKAVVETWRLAENRFDVSTQIVRDAQGPTLQASPMGEEPNAVYDLSNRRPLAIPNLSKHSGAELYFRRNGRWFAFERGKVIDLAANRQVFSEPGGAAGVRLSPDGKTLVFRSPGGDDPSKRRFVVLDIATWRVLHRLKPDEGVPGQDFCFLTPDVLANPAGTTQLWNLRTGKTIAWIVAWANTESVVEGGLKASRRDWAIGLPDGRFFGSEAAQTLLLNAKSRDVGVLKELGKALGWKELG